MTERQKKIAGIVKEKEPITGEQIAEQLSVTRAAIRSDLAVLTMSHILEAKPRVGYFYAKRQPRHVIGDMIRRMKVNDVKSVPYVIRESSTVYDAIVMLFLEDIGTLFVVGEKGALEGVISRKDLLKAAMGKADLHKMPIGIVMTRMPNIVMVNQDDSVYEAARKIVLHEVDALPVVRLLKREGSDTEQAQGLVEVVGRVTKTTIARLFVEMAEGRGEDEIDG